MNASRAECAQDAEDRAQATQRSSDQRDKSALASNNFKKCWMTTLKTKSAAKA
jgi:hypothetical protein